jgi:hypothetical protein
MIDNTHLRPSNIVCTGKKDDGTDEIGKIVKVESELYSQWNGSWDVGDVPVEIEGGFWVCDEVYPIKLTEEWFEKLGFVLEDDKWYLDSDDNLFFCSLQLVTPSNTPDKVDLWVSFGDNMEGIVDAYVHTLQNLFWGFTGGKELSIEF